jgi:hypothetical protein
MEGSSALSFHAFDYHLLLAWKSWLNGRLESGDTFLDISILWWGRYGLTAQFVASILLLWDGAGSQWSKSFVLWVQATKKWANAPGNVADSIQPRGANSVMQIYGFATLTIPGLLLYWASTKFPGFRERLNWLDSISFSSQSHWLKSQLISALILAIYCTCWLPFFFGLAKFFFWLAELRKFPVKLKLPAIGLLILGFHFALLAS